jgi:hypothetical protein
LRRTQIYPVNPEPKLAPPGAGPLIAADSDLDINANEFERFNLKILLKLEGLDPALLEQKVPGHP